jgi:hypothetical protein
MEKLLRNLLIGLAILVVLVPLGLLAVGTAFGEWGVEDLAAEVGFIPAGLESVASTWSAPLPDYALPAIGDSFLDLSLGYWMSAIIGVLLCAGVIVLIGRLITSSRSKNNGQL